MRDLVALAGGAVLFVLLATANSGGYRYGVSDQAFYQPAVAISVDPTLFPRDRVVLESQTKLWLGDSVLAFAARLVGGDLPTLFVIVYVVTLLALFTAAIALSNALAMDRWTTAIFLILLTLRHRIPKTGANSLEGYMHPRMLAFACGLAALSALVRNRMGVAVLFVAVAALVHTTVALWFGAALAAAVGWQMGARKAAALAGSGILVVAIVVASVDRLRWRVSAMDGAWVAVLGDKDYLFLSGWPAYAWLLNLAYPAVLWLIYRRRDTMGLTVPGEPALIAGCIALAGIFVISVPFNLAEVALAVQLQVNRVFWLLDAVVSLYIAWWIASDVFRHRFRAAAVVAAVLVGLSMARGAYIVVVDNGGRLVTTDLEPSAWTDAMRWLRTQPSSWHVFADPLHAVTLGPSVRVAAERDTLLESNKDSALAMYDRTVAMRLAERERAVGDFSSLRLEDIRRLARTYGLDVLVDRNTRQFELPILYRNAEFNIYDLR